MYLQIFGRTLAVSMMALALMACSGDESESTTTAATPDTAPDTSQAPAPASPPGAPPEAAGETDTETGTGSELDGTSWTLVKIQSMDDSVAEPAADTAYSITFNADGSANMQVDCNRGAGSWESPSAGRVTFGPLALTRAMCPPGSIHDQFVRELEYVRTYTMRDGNLYLATMADGSILEFEPLAD